MQTILETTNMVDLSFAKALLKDAGIAFFLADQHISVTEGSVGIFPRRLMVMDEDANTARTLMYDAGLLTGQPTRNAPAGDTPA